MIVQQGSAFVLFGNGHDIVLKFKSDRILEFWSERFPNKIFNKQEQNKRPSFSISPYKKHSYQWTVQEKACEGENNKGAFYGTITRG